MLDLVPFFCFDSELLLSIFFCQPTSILSMNCCDLKAAAQTYIHAILGRSKFIILPFFAIEIVVFSSFSLLFVIIRFDMNFSFRKIRFISSSDFFLWHSSKSIATYYTQFSIWLLCCTLEVIRKQARSTIISTHTHKHIKSIDIEKYLLI